MNLTDRQQALVMFLVFVIPAFIVWFGLEMPTDRAAIGLLAANILSGILAGLKELAGWKES